MNKYINASSDSTLYTGQVEIKISKNKVPYRIIKEKNTGTSFFHKYILQCLVDGNLNLNLRPYGIRLYGSGATGERSSKLLYKTIFPGVNLTTEPKEGDGKTTETIESTIDLNNERIKTSPYYIKYHFLIPESFCDGTKKVYNIAMCNALGNPYAVVTIPDEGLILESGVNIDITWTLSVGSSDSNSENNKKED